MDPTIQAELERQQSTMLEKLSSIMDNKLESMKRQLEESSNTQMSELKKIRLTGPRNFKKKGHEQQYKHNEQVKSAVNEAKDAVVAGKNEACIAKLNEGIELIDQRQKLILIADKSDYGWKTVGEYLDDELADDDQDAKKMKKAEKEAQRKIAESRAAKATKARPWFRNPRSPGNTIANSSPSSSPFSLSAGNYSPRFSSSTGGTRGIGSFPFSSGTAPKRGTCFSCGKPGHWRNECPLLAVAGVQEGKKLSANFYDLYDAEPVSGNSEFSEFFDDPIDSCIFTTPAKGDFSELECGKESVRGRLKSHFSAWEEIGSPSSVLSVITEGYKLPLLTIPESCILSNNKSAIDNACFVTKALEDLIAANCISIVHSPPWVVNPLTVSVRAEGKKRLVLDLRHVNPHLFKYKFKCEDISTAQQLLGEGYYLYTFDIKSAYHHVEIFDSHRTYLGFQWPYQGKPTYFVFNVLPFGMSTAPYIFTKVLKPVINYWRSAGRRICMFLDDGLGGNSCKESASTDAIAVRADLAKLGFLLSVDKCVWNPSLIQTWLGYILNMSENRLYVTDTRVSNLRESISSVLANPQKVTARRLAEVTGRIISMHKAIGSAVYLYTRQMYLTIETRDSWDSFISCSPRVINELQFWHNNVSQLNGRDLFDKTQVFDSVVYSDASQLGYGGYVISDKQNLVCQGQWSLDEKRKSSTWRELRAVYYMLSSVGHILTGHKVQWYTDNQNVTHIIDRGSTKPDLQTLAEEIVNLCNNHRVSVIPVWVPRDNNQLADYLSKLTDVDDWGIHSDIFQWLNTLWGPFTVDRFATWYNTKCIRFNSRFWNPGSEGVDAFIQNWQGENNWVVPPPSQIIRAWRHFELCKAKGVLIIPLWKGASFWPCICPDGTHLSKCVIDWVGVPEFHLAATTKGRSYNSLFHGEKLEFKLIALYVNWQSVRKGHSDRGFCLSVKGLCEHCTKG